MQLRKRKQPVSKSGLGSSLQVLSNLLSATGANGMITLLEIVALLCVLIAISLGMGVPSVGETPASHLIRSMGQQGLTQLALTTDTLCNSLIFVKFTALLIKSHAPFS